MRRAHYWIGVFLLLGLAAAAQANGDAEGASAFQATCGGCHNEAKALELANRYASPEELDAYLATHFAKDAESRGKIIEYLRTRAAAQ
jgi:cytochrome c553